MAGKKTSPESDELRLRKATDKAREILSERGFASGTKLGPPKLRARVVAALVAEGYEKQGTKLRQALERQCETQLASGAHLPWTQLAKRLKGTTATEAKKVAARLAKEGRARLVLRGKELTLVPNGEKVAEVEAIAKLASELTEVASWLKKARKAKPAATVLLADLEESMEAVLSAMTPPNREPRSPTTTANSWAAKSKSPNPDLTSPALSDASPWASIASAITALANEDSGLARVAEVSRRVHNRFDTKRVTTELLEKAAQGIIELRPEGGLGRLSAEDAALCPRGAGGLPLSWVRMKELER